MKPTKPTKTESTFATNKEVRELAGHSDYKRGDIKDISVSLYDVDYAVKWHLENKVAPTITEENSIITVPIMFAAGEKAAAVQKYGFLRDNQGKLLTPLIMIKRNSVSKRDDIQDLKVLETLEARITFERKYTSANKYDRFGLTGKAPQREMYSIDVPKFVQVEYELLIWTNNTSQLNEVVEQLMWFDGKAFGESHKFITHIDTPSFETLNNTGEDRIVRANMAMRTKAYILNTHGANAPSMYKLNPVNNVVIAQEVDAVIDSAAMKTAVLKTATLDPGFYNSTETTTNDILYYLNTNRQFTGTATGLTTVVFNSGWEAAPSGLPLTSVDNFTFFVNGTLLERSAIVSFTEVSANSSVLIVNTSRLGYTLDGTDEIIGIGKFLAQDS